MKLYEVEYFETIRHVIIVKAKDEQEAELFAEEYYIEGNKTSFIKEHNQNELENSIGETREVEE